MTEAAPISLDRIEKYLQSAINAQDKLTTEFLETVREFETAETEFNIRFAQERFTARTNADIDGVKMTEKLADDIATNKTKDERRSMAAARARIDATRQSLNSVRKKMDAYQTLSANHRVAGG